LNGARDNPEMEGFNSRFKAENCSLFLDAQDVGELAEVVCQRMVYYNTERRHSSIDYLSPVAYFKQKGI
jgi:transposase InsO family protein